MARYSVISLVDITHSNPSRSETDPVRLGQQANFNALVQAIGLRANIVWDSDPKQQRGQLPGDLKGKATYWTWDFRTDSNDIFLKGSDPVGWLIDDLHGVPVSNKLNNSVDIEPSVFLTKGDKINIWLSEIT